MRVGEDVMCSMMCRADPLKGRGVAELQMRTDLNNTCATTLLAIAVGPSRQRSIHIDAVTNK